MPVRVSMFNLSELPANVALQHGLDIELEGTSPNSSHDTKLNSDSGPLRDPFRTPFPSLTGLRPQNKSTEPKSVTIGSRVTLLDLQNVTVSLGASPIAALQAAWAVILSVYTAADGDVFFTTVFTSSASHEKRFHAIPTSVCLSTTQKWGDKVIGSILKHLTEANALDFRRSKQRVLSAACHEDMSKYGTSIALRSKECGHYDGVFKSCKESFKDEVLAVQLVASPDREGFLEFQVLYIDLVLNENSALVMSKQLGDVLAFILANPAQPILNSLAAIRPSLLSTSNESPESTDFCLQSTHLHAQFEKFASHSPHRVALEFRKDIKSGDPSNVTTWTYEQLNDKAEVLALHLIHRFGQLTDEVIPICMERRPELYVAILGVLKTGGAWCPIDPSFPARRRHDLIARTRARILVVAEQKPADKTEGIPHGIVTVGIISLEERMTDWADSPRAKMGSLAYLIWTSGTTGDPKGVPIHHKAAVTSMRALQRSIPVDVTGGIVRCLQFSQFTFDVFVQDLFYTWGVGGTIISSAQDVVLGSFAELATKTNATHAHLTPAFAASVPRKRCPTLEVITMIGEKLPQSVADDWSQDMRAFNTYGPAETTVVSTFRQFGAAGDEVQSDNIGFPLASVSAFVMRDDRPLMRQGIGELALGGPQLSQGYWNDPARSAERFVWNEQSSRHLYMTGDLVRQLHDGSLEFIGRTDDLIKIQGIRVELSEIGFSLRFCHPLVEQVEIQYLHRQDRPSKVIVAFLAAPKLDDTKGSTSHLLTSEESISIAKSALLEAHKVLPSYMIPRVFLVMNSIPRTSSAKTDKAFLNKIYNLINLELWERTLASKDNNINGTSWSTRESDIIMVVAELSGTSPSSMSRASELRTIGIDSIAATRLAPLLNTKGFSISVTDILQCEDLDDLSKVTKKSSNMHKTQRYDLESFHNEWYIRVRKEIKRNDVFVAPALPLQESLLSESMQNASAYWSNTFLHLDSQVDINHLHKAWLQVVSDTEALRTGFIPSAEISENPADAFVMDTTFLQLIYEESAIDWTCEKSSEADMKHRATQRAHAVAERHQKDQFRHPLLAITIFELPNHRLMMISIHHSVRDESSLDFILQDVNKSYKTLNKRSGHRIQLREALQVMLPTKTQIDQDEMFWSKALEDFVTTNDVNTWPDLTGKNTRREDPAESFITHTQALKSNYGVLQGAALRLGASSAASILRVAWGIVLLEYLEIERVVFAETWSSRIVDVALADVVGPLTTVLPVPFHALGSAREALIAQSQLQLHSRAHRSIHPRVIRKLLSRSESQVLYPSVFNFLPNLREDSQDSCYSMWNKMGNIIGITVEHPIALNVMQLANGTLEMEVSASQTVMSSAHLAILALQVDAFVEAILSSPDIPLTQLSSRFPKNLLSITSVSFSQNVRLAWKQNPTDWVDHHATTHPHWPAAQVVTLLSNEKCECESWSFVELHSAYNRVAAFISHGGLFNQMIALCLDRRIEAYAVILGIMASGNIYLPIDEDLPGTRKSFLLQDSEAAMLFTTRSLASTFASIQPGSRVIYVDDGTYMQQMVNSYSVETHSKSKASDNAYLLYTSGSTGVPKGVLVGRGNLCSFVEGLSEFIFPLIPGMKELPGKGKYLGLASRAFDVHIAEMFLAWRQGLAAVTASRTMLLDNLELALRKLKITHVSFVPSLIDQAGLDPANLPDLHYLGVGGEKMSKSVIDVWASNDNAALVNAYGPTEMSIGCTAAEVTRESNLRNVGRPYGNSVAHVLVPGSDRYTLRGVAGELCFTGDLVANGYHNRPDAKGFVNDFHGERMYRTGDIVRLMADDTLEYLRREDDQTKVRGQRLELGEITEAIRSTAVTTLGVKKIDVATMVAQHPKLSRPQLISFIVPSPQSNRAQKFPETISSTYDTTIASKIQAGCRKVLPAYMVPDLVIPLTKLPLAPSSGKADMKRLKALFADIPIAHLVHHTSSEEPNQSDASHRELTEAEKNLRIAVVSTLAVDTAEISSNTNIFRLGLDSLSAITLAIKMQKLGYECTVSSILKNPSLEQLVSLPQNEQNKGALTDRFVRTRSKLADFQSRFLATRSHGLKLSSIQAIKPCLPLQETLVATSLNEKSGALYVNHIALKLSSEVDHVRLYEAWTKVVADHEILRTCFQEFDNGIVQTVLRYDESRSIFWEETATSDLESAFQLQRNKSATEIISNITTKVPMRLTLFRPPAGDASSLLLLSIHHALFDRESIAMVLEELNMRYHSAIPSAHTSFDSMIEYVCSQDQEAAKVFWGNYLAHYRPTSIVDPADITDDDPKNTTFLTVDRTLASPLTELQDFSSSINATLTSTIQAVFGIILAQTLQTQDLVFGAILSGRTVPIENPHTIVAPCITTIPQRVNIRTNSATILDILKDTQQGFVASLEFQHIALRQIHRWVGAQQPLFDGLVSYVQKSTLKPSPYPYLWTELEGSMPNEFPLSIEFEADHEAGKMRAHCAFSPAFGDSDRAASLLENIDLLLGALLRQENVTTENLGILKSDAEDSRSKPQVWDESHWTAKELEMRELAAEICGTKAEDISRGASFFSLGIDSITAIRFARRLRDSGLECSSADVMRHSCIAALAQKIDFIPPQINTIAIPAERSQEHNFKHVIPKIPILGLRDTVTDVYPCTPLQSSMLTQTLGSYGRLYYHHHPVRLARDIDLPRLKRAWECLTVKTEILRTTFYFSDADNSWLAAVHQEFPAAWAECDTRTSMPDSLIDVMKYSALHEATDYERPPWKTTVLKNATEIVLLISMHHSLYDGESIGLLFQDLARLYEGIELPPRAPFSDAARAIAKSKTDAEQFWSQKLDGFESSEVPPSQNANETDMIEIEIALKTDIEMILRRCKDLGVTIQTVALLAFGKSLACISGRRDIVFGHVVGGRSLAMPGADEVIGPLFNTVPSRIVFDKTYVTNKIAAIEVQQVSGDSQTHQHASLGKVQQEWRQRVGDANAQLFDTLFVFQNSANRASPTDGLWTPFDVSGFIAPTEYSTNFEFEQREERIILRVASRKKLRTREQLQAWLTEFEQIFHDILNHSQRSVMAFPSSLQSLPLSIERYNGRPSPPDSDMPGSDFEFVRRALSEVSGISPESIPVDASIFSLGLDSISAIRIAATCRKQGHTLTVADVLQGRSLRGIRLRLRERSLDQDSDQTSHVNNQITLISEESRSKALVLANVKENAVEYVLPCLAGQQYHLATWLKSRRTMCEAVFTYRCSKSLSVDDLRHAWRGLRERHSVLRSIFVALSPKEAVQVILKPSTLNDDSFRYLDPSDDSEEMVIEQIKHGLKRPFDLFSPPSKVSLVRENTQDFVVLKLHHATYDAWTVQTLAEDLAALYQGIQLPSPLRFDSFINHTLRSLHTDAEAVYWHKGLKDCQQTLLQPSITKSDLPPATKSTSPSTTSVSIRSAIPKLQSLETACRQLSTSLPTAILLAYARVLARHTSVTNPTFGLYQAGRSASFKGVDKLCAPCLNLTPVVIQDALERPALESAQRLHSDLAERVGFEQSYLHEVLEWVGCGGKPLFNTFVNILSHEGKTRDSPSESSLSSGTTATTSVEPLLIPWEPANILMDLATTEPMELGRTAVDALEVGYLAEKNFYLDVVRRVENACIDFSIRCDKELMDEGMVRAFAIAISEEVEKIVQGFERDGVEEHGQEEQEGKVN